MVVVEHGSFTAAAESMGVSKSNLSQHVTGLERELGVTLLHRTTRRLRLSEAGKHYHQWCANAIQQLSSAQEWATQSTHELRGTLRMNAVGGLIGEEVIAPLIIQFQQAYPSIDVVLDFSSHQVDLLASEYDVVMRMGALPDSSLIARRLCSIHTRFVATPAFIEQYGTIKHPRDLKGLPLVYGSVREWALTNGNEHYSVFAERGFQIANGRVMTQAMKAGLGVGRLADIYVQRALIAGELIEVLPEWAEFTPLSLLCPPTRYQLHRVRLLMDWLVEHFADLYRCKMLGT